MGQRAVVTAGVGLGGLRGGVAGAEAPFLEGVLFHGLKAVAFPAVSLARDALRAGAEAMP